MMLDGPNLVHQRERVHRTEHRAQPVLRRSPMSTGARTASPAHGSASEDGRRGASSQPEPRPPRNGARPGKAHPAHRGHRRRGAHRRAARRAPRRRSRQGQVTGQPANGRPRSDRGGSGHRGRDAGPDAGGAAVRSSSGSTSGTMGEVPSASHPPASGAGVACGPLGRGSPRVADRRSAAAVARTNTAAGPSGRAGRRMARLLDPASSGARVTDPRRRPTRVNPPRDWQVFALIAL